MDVTAPWQCRKGGGGGCGKARRSGPGRNSFAADRLAFSFVVEPLVEGEGFAAGADRRGGDQENTIVHSHELRVATRSLGLGVGEARNANLTDVPLHRVFIRDRRINAPHGIPDTLDVSGLALLSIKISDNCNSHYKGSRQICMNAAVESAHLHLKDICVVNGNDTPLYSAKM